MDSTSGVSVSTGAMMGRSVLMTMLAVVVSVGPGLAKMSTWVATNRTALLPN
jgi:hypothetical protein